MSVQRVAFVTFGCRVNQYETDVMMRRLAPSFDLVDRDADLYILNGCTVTGLAEKKARQAVRRIRRTNPSSKIILVGCLADAVKAKLSTFPPVDLLVGHRDTPAIAAAVRCVLEARQAAFPLKAAAPRLDDERSAGPRGRVRAFLKIQDGCSRACTYCRPTQVRGPSRSKSLTAVLREAEDLVSRGYPELVLTGINLAEYRSDDARLADVVRAMVDIAGLRRLRLASINPEGISDDLLAAFRDNAARLCPHFHIPLQSGDDAILRAMARGYTAADYRTTIAAVRASVPRATFGTDIIVGFPGEDEAAFEATCQFVEEIGFANLHVFRYARRVGTPSASWDSGLTRQIVQHRRDRLTTRWRVVLQRILDERRGRIEDILIEQRDGQRCRGYTSDYLFVTFTSTVQPCVGDLVPVRITNTAYGLEGVTNDRHREDRDHIA